MPRDYKHHARRRKRKTVSPWFGMVAGLLTGLFIAFLVYIKMIAPGHPGSADTGPEIPDAAAETPPAEEPGTEEKREAPPKPRFEFYAILPEMEVIVPEEEIETASAPAPIAEKSTRKPPPKAPTETYYLQAGSFRGADQADRFKAELAMLGFETDIQTITIDNKDTFHRVRVGPYTSTASLQEARSRLGKQGIETRIVRLK
jgi:cell division protein FtsN